MVMTRVLGTVLFGCAQAQSSQFLQKAPSNSDGNATGVSGPSANHGYRALFVVGTEPEEPLYADLVFQQRLEQHGFSVHLIKDSEATNQDCEAFDVMLVSASISGGALGKKVNECTKPQLIWEVGLYQNNGMAAPSHEDAWVTSPYWSKYHQDAWIATGYAPPAPTGAGIVITEDGAGNPLAAGLGQGEVPIFSVEDFGQNWVNMNSLGRGAQVVGILPFEKTQHWQNETSPQQQKAVLFYYEKGAELYAAEGEVAQPSPALRIAFPPYNFIYGSDPSCEELSGVPGCDECQKDCLTASAWKAEDESRNPMPLSEQGLTILDAAIGVLKEEARKDAEQQAVTSFFP